MAFSAAGADLVLVGRTKESLENVAAIIRSRGGKVEIRVCDVTQSAAVRDLISGIDTLDILV
ncbi:SDR family NAD(P)-dependent oxidoreductase, partial [Pandoraea sputorum]|uniref:SDR family NAD(P)-dependent oxidoreductase n=1 Tax=Pandoraea sputorum TaxID=93222 RepID=UPI003558598E